MSYKKSYIDYLNRINGAKKLATKRIIPYRFNLIYRDDRNKIRHLKLNVHKRTTITGSFQFDLISVTRLFFGVDVNGEKTETTLLLDFKSASFKMDHTSLINNARVLRSIKPSDFLIDVYHHVNNKLYYQLTSSNGYILGHFDILKHRTKRSYSYI